jgi:hypothetical protein
MRSGYNFIPFFMVDWNAQLQSERNVCSTLVGSNEKVLGGGPQVRSS